MHFKLDVFLYPYLSLTILQIHLSAKESENEKLDRQSLQHQLHKVLKELRKARDQITRLESSVSFSLMRPDMIIDIFIILLCNNVPVLTLCLRNSRESLVSLSPAHVTGWILKDWLFKIEPRLHLKFITY